EDWYELYRWMRKESVVAATLSLCERMQGRALLETLLTCSNTTEFPISLPGCVKIMATIE
ncbi:MAG TPA: hypothetical protein K8V56_08400, partial [Sporosarcina psychrophila]|nr:hypothetical protein [Sporosarcina psychrophila]